ncbi:MAG TPA: MipA/OmpV family protein [Burkholderiaceae bacterium]|jgi:hypothetical protein|nr:MipA/OmpV family protein [Burkholderiaceae bacterium]
MPSRSSPRPCPWPRACALALVVVAGVAKVQAQTDPPADPTTPDLGNPGATYPLWEVGLYPLATWEPAYPGSDEHLRKVAILPYAVFRGSLWRIERGGVGVRALKTPRFEWDVSASGAFGSSASDVRARAGMPGIDTLVQLGPALRVNIGDLVAAGGDPRATRIELPVRAVFDASRQLGLEGWTMQPEIMHVAWRGASSSIVVEANMLFADRRYASLFYGVDPAYATPDRPAYAARPGLVSSGLAVYWRTQLNSRLRMQWFVEAQTVRGGANEDSPLVRRRQDVGLGASLTWAAFVSHERGAE